MISAMSTARPQCRLGCAKPKPIASLSFEETCFCRRLPDPIIANWSCPVLVDR